MRLMALDYVNPNLDYEKIQKIIQEEKYVVIEDFLSEEYAEQLYTWLNETMAEDWWASSSLPNKDGTGEISSYRVTPENKLNILSDRHYATMKMLEGHFSYLFHRTFNDHYEECTCLSCDFFEKVNSPEFNEILSKLTGLEINGAQTFFAAKYIQGDFLSPHHDEGLGKLGFTLQLTKDWQPHYGGLLHFVDDSATKIEKVVIPKFNKLTLFYLPDGKGKMHYVSHVHQGVPHNRLTFTGWFGYHPENASDTAY